MSKYYVRTNEGAYLKSHAEFTHYWTKKRDDAEQLSLMEAMKVMDHNKDKLKKGVELYIEAIDDEPVDEFDDVTHQRSADSRLKQSSLVHQSSN